MNMKTMHVVFGCLMIFVINTEVEAEIEVSFNQIKSVVDWGMNTYREQSGMNDGEELPDNTRENVEIILGKVNEISSSLENLEMKMDIKLDRMLSILLADIQVTAGLEQAKTKLCEYIDRVDNFFDNAMIYKLGSTSAGKTLQEFHESVLWCQNNLPNLLDNIYDLFVPGVQSEGFLRMMSRRAALHLAHDCDDGVSVQQQIYYVYIQVIIAEMKSLLIIKQIYTTQSMIQQPSSNYTAELEYAKQQYMNRLHKYHAVFSQNMRVMPRQIRRCDVNYPERNVNYIEMSQFSRANFLDGKFVNDNGCSTCPSTSALETLSLRRGSHIENCIAMGDHVEVCEANRGSIRDYMWLQKNGETYGDKTPCNRQNHLNAYPNCQLCLCSEDLNDEMINKKHAVLKISALEKYSDIENNMVVTGVRFAHENGILHLQIQQASFSKGGVAKDTSEWKPIIPKPSTKRRREKRKPSFYSLLHNRKTIHLDDIVVLENHAVTGVRFQTVGDPATAFELQVHGTRFDFNTGDLDPETGTWLRAATSSLRTKDYRRPRQEINMGRADDPKKRPSFDYDVESHKQIKFTHTDLHKDAGQTTIPLFDAQPVYTHPPFPLGGVGIAFKGADGTGGYIALRIHTIDISNYMTPDDSPGIEQSVNDSGGN